MLQKLLVKHVPIRTDFNFSSLCDIESSPKYTQNEIKKSWRNVVQINIGNVNFVKSNKTEQRRISFSKN